MTTPRSTDHNSDAPHGTRWRLGSAGFEFTSDCAALTRRVADLMRIWSQLQLPTAPTGATTIHPISATAWEDGWIFRGKSGVASLCPDGDAVLRAVETEAVHAIVENTVDFLTIHGALVSQGGAGLLLVGASQAGKSTLAYAVAAHGLHLHGDDVAMLFPPEGGHGTTAMAVPRRISLRTESQAHLARQLWDDALRAKSACITAEDLLFRPDQTGGPDAVRLSAVWILEAEAQNGPVCEPAPLSPPEALLRLATYTNVARFDNMGAALGRLGPLLREVPVFSSRRRPLAEMVSAAKQMLARVSAS